MSEERYLEIVESVIDFSNAVGDFQVAYKNMNLPDTWGHAYSILKVNARARFQLWRGIVLF